MMNADEIYELFSKDDLADMTAGLHRCREKDKATIASLLSALRDLVDAVAPIIDDIPLRVKVPTSEMDRARAAIAAATE